MDCSVLCHLVIYYYILLLVVHIQQPYRAPWQKHSRYSWQYNREQILIWVATTTFAYNVACAYFCVFISGATAARDHIVPVFGARPGWRRWRRHDHKSHFSCGGSPKDQPGAGETPTERWRRRRRHSLCLFWLFRCHWDQREWTHDLPRIRERLLWRRSAATTEAQKRSPRQQGRIAHCQFAKLCPLAFPTYTEDQWGTRQRTSIWMLIRMYMSSFCEYRNAPHEHMENSD